MDVLYYIGDMGFCANLINLIRVIEYCFRRNVKLYVCCDYSMHGKIHELFDFGPDVQFVNGVPPGWSITENPHFEVVHPEWDHGDTVSLKNYMKITNLDVPEERLREIALRFVPKVSLDTAAQRQRKSRALHASPERPNILGRLLPKRDRVRLVQFKQTGIILLTKNLWFFAVGILQTRWKFLR